MSTVLLARHGETTWNRAGRIQGWADASLTDRGREQARALGARLAEHGVDRLVASDLQRTRETVACVREAGPDLDPAFSRAWRERDFGDYQGLSRTEIADRHPGYDADGSLLALPAVPGGESLIDTDERVRAGWESLLADLGDTTPADTGDETVAVVTHGGPIRVVIAAVTGQDLQELVREFSPGNCGITTLDSHETGSELIERDDCSHLRTVGE